MATYKVIQDIEAEDKLLGPLTLRQFIYAGIAVACLYLSFLVTTKGAPFLLVVFLPVAFVCGFFAFPFKQDQPTEVWALARVRFMIKPHRRIWDQSGVKQLVTITAPKKVNINYTKGLSQTEVKSRLKALADTIDTRGWAVKNVNVSLYAQPRPEVQEVVSSDRLINPGAFQQDVPLVDVQARDDILDEHNSPVAQNFDRLITASNVAHRQQIVQGLNQQAAGVQPRVQSQAPPNDYWFLNQPSQPAGSAMFGSQVVAPGTQTDGVLRQTSADDRALAQQLKARKNQPDLGSSRLRTIQPLSQLPIASQNPPAAIVKKNANAPVTPTPNPDIVKLAGDNDKNVATLQRLANRQQLESSSSNEVVISLH